MDDNKKHLMWEVLNVFENDSQSPETDYSTIYIYADGPGDKRQLTLGRGITEYGNMQSLIQEYIRKKGALADDFRPFVDKIGKTALVNDKTFRGLIIRASKEDSVFRECEDIIFEKKYFAPAFNFFTAGGFSENLSMMVILDSYLHSGSIPSFLRSRFQTKLPSKGGDEYKWITDYITVRRSWLANHSRAALRGTVYRMDCFKKQIANRNWAFNPPIIANGVTLKS